ncbi:Bug family tripartite tricarboxylate transporter substrate binding protein [Galactobacter caseinivorans]|nr:tripartite tricarboxylate transporter substrate-binding protein [Galactobacter caseinivorans]
MKRRTVLRSALLGGAAALTGSTALAGCSAPPATSARRLMVPNLPGGGYDATARTAAKILGAEGLTEGQLEVFNLPGASGLVGLSRMAAEAGNGALGMVMGLGLLGAAVSAGRQQELLSTTPLVLLLTEPGVVMVPRSSRWFSLGEMVRQWRRDPGAVRMGGGSAVGGPDHLLPMQLARAAGMSPDLVKFSPYDGGGDLMPALLGGPGRAPAVDVGVSGPGEFLPQIRSGAVRVLAVSGDTRLPGVDAPTLAEAGFDVDFANWRGVVAPPGIPQDAVQEWRELLGALATSPAWEQACRDSGWQRRVPGTDVASFLAQQARTVKDTLAELGLATQPPRT